MSRRGFTVGPVVALALLVAAGLPGCLAGPDLGDGDPGTYTFEAPDGGGRWQLLGTAGNGTPATVRLTGSTEYAADGTLRTAPVLRVEADPLPLDEGVHFQTRYWVHQLGPDGVVANRAEGDLVFDAGDRTSRADMDILDGVPDPGHDRGFPSAYLYGVGLWGKTLTVGERRPMPDAMPAGWHRETGPPVFELTAIEDGCATVRVDAPSFLLRIVAEAVYCDGPLPETIELLEPGERMLRLERVADGAPLPSPVSEPDRATEPAGVFPPDGSDLAFPLDRAAEAIRTHPVTATWLDQEPDARALQGRLRSTGCRLTDDPFTLTPSSCPSLDRADALSWEIVLASPDDGLRVTVRRSLEPTASPPTVVEMVPTDRRLTNHTDDRAVPLADALDAVDRVRGDAWKRLGVGFWTHGPTPWWSAYGEIEMDDGGTYSGPVNVYWPDGRLEGYVDPLG